MCVISLSFFSLLRWHEVKFKLVATGIYRNFEIVREKWHYEIKKKLISASLCISQHRPSFKGNLIFFFFTLSTMRANFTLTSTHRNFPSNHKNVENLMRKFFYLTLPSFLIVYFSARSLRVEWHDMFDKDNKCSSCPFRDVFVFTLLTIDFRGYGRKKVANVRIIRA